MPEITVTCDRCGKTIEGAIYFDEGIGGTAGYYNVIGTAWNKYANEGERIVCDQCMWTDERYLRDYPYMRQEPPKA